MHAYFKAAQSLKIHFILIWRSHISEFFDDCVAHAY